VCGVPTAQVISPDEGDVRLASGGRPVTLKVDPQTVGASQFVVGMETVPPGVPFPTHKHPNQGEILFVHKGTMTVTLGAAQPKEAVAGSVVFIPKGTCVGMANRGSEPATFVFIFPQTGIEDFFRRAMPKAGEASRTPEERATARRDHQHNMVIGPC
jgi:quercetin dioxygenase-like cupin family protein